MKKEKTKKIKIKLDEFVSYETLEEIPAQYIIVTGGRNNGKSFASKELIIRHGLQGEEFAYIRRYKEDCKQYMVQDYFGDIIATPILDKNGDVIDRYNSLEKWTNGKYNTIVTYQSGIFFAHYDEETDKTTRGPRFGKMFGLSWDEHYKSIALPYMKFAVYEEFITEGQFLPNEPRRFMNLISTIFRSSKGKVILVGNTLSRINPFFKEWQLKNIKKMQPNQIDYYHFKFKQTSGKESMTTVAVYMTHSREANSGMFFGNAAKQITETVWEAEEADHLTVDKRSCNSLYKVVMQYDDNMFMLDFLELPDGNVTWYVEPKTTEIQPGTRVVSNELRLDELSTKNFRGLTEKEQLLFRYLQDDRIVYADNLCAAEFKQCYSMLRRAGL